MNQRRGIRILDRLRKWRLAPCLFVGLGVAAGLAGCTRTFYRDAADNEVEGILAEKDTNPLWKIEQFHVYPDPRARFADPSCPDHPPMPPDDLDTFLRSPHPQQPGKAGVGLVQGTAWLEMINAWDAANRAEREAAEKAEEKRIGEMDFGSPGGKKDPALLPPPVPLEPKKTPEGVKPDGAKPEKQEVPELTLTSARQVETKKADDLKSEVKVAVDDPKHPVATYFDEPLRAKQPGFLLKLDQAIELGVVNSPQYQNFREQLYEEALPVTLQRFNFAYQWAASEDFVREWAGPLASGSSGSSTTRSSSSSTSNGASASTTNSPTSSAATNSTTPSPNANSTTSVPTTNTTTSTSTLTTPGTSGPSVNNWTGTSSVSFSKLFSTGALLTFDFVNTNVWNFVAPRGFTSTSTIDLNFTQPLLQGGGKAVTLEPLTQAERNLFYSIRAYARFREQFFVSIALGSSLPADLAQASGAGAGTNPISVLAALGIASTDVSGGFVGYLSTLYRECDMATDKKLVRDLERALRIYEGYQEGGQFSPLQVDQVRSTLLQAQNTVLTDQQFVNNALDQFKLVLGLPANLPLILDDTPARPVTNQLDRYYEVISDSDAAYKLVEAQEDLTPEKLRAFLLDLYSRGPLVRGTEFQKRLPISWRNWTKATDAELKARLDKLREERRTLLDRKTDVELKGGTLTEKEARTLRDDEIEADLASLEQILRRYDARPWEKVAKAEARKQDRLKLFRLVAYSAEIVLVWARNERFDNVGKRWPTLAKAPLGEMDLSSAEVQRAQEFAVQHALSSRWDLMNARAQLVDSWRQLRVTANALMGVFNVGYNLHSSTPPGGTRPFAFSTDRTSSSLSLDTQLPLNRLAQRNAYRVALINYQQQRRALMTLEDNIAVQVRFDVRQLQLFAANYRIQKRVLQSLYAQVESALEVITAPADPSALQATGTTGQANAAALTSQYLNALSSLNGAQARMYDIWLSYIATRMQLYLDLESLRMDERGVWLEENGILSGTDSACTSSPAAAPSGRTTEEAIPNSVDARVPVGGLPAQSRSSLP